MDTDNEHLYFACNIDACPKCGATKIWVSHSKAAREKFDNNNVVKVDCVKCCKSYYVELYDILDSIRGTYENFDL